MDETGIQEAMDSSNKNSQDAPNVMNNSERYSEKRASDEEDLKSSIPFYTEPTNADDVDVDDAFNTLLTSLKDEGEDPNAYKFPSCEDDDDDYLGEAEARLDNSYAYPANAEKFLVEPVPPNTSRAYQSTPQEPQYPDVVFRPPSLHYNYNYPAQERRSLHASAYPANPTQAPASPHPVYGGHPAGFHPNMWYPNAPYSCGGFYPQHAQHRFPHYGSGYPHEAMVDMLQLSNSGREARNRAEKNRRDKLNGSIQELSTMVPHVAESPRRVDKTAVLRLAAHGLRLQYVFGNTINQTRPEVTDSLMKLLDSFFITLTCHGQITLISSSIEQHLGHCQTDLYGLNILHITHPDDHNIMKEQLIPKDLETLFDIQPDSGAEEPRHRTKEEEDYIDQKLSEDKRNFTVRLARAGPRSEPTSYEIVKLYGCFRRSDAAPRGLKTSSFPSGLQLIRRTRGRDDAIPLHTISGNDIVFNAIGRIMRPPKIINKIIEANNFEYKTRHLIDGRIVECDQRIGLVAGYMTDEVRNLNSFTFMHQDDVRWVIVALRTMYDCYSSYGESTYRLLSRNGHFIYLQSKGYLDIDKDTNQIHSVVCVNTLLDEEEGKRRLKEMKNKYSVIINTEVPASNIDAPASDNPQQLEKQVLCLIQNLQKTTSDDEDVESMPSEYASETIPHVSLSSRAMSSCSLRTTKTPPLAIVPPEPSSVKTSISKSISVVNVTAAKNLRGHQLQSQSAKSPISPLVSGVIDDLRDSDLRATQEYSGKCQHQSDALDCQKCEKSKYRISHLKRTSSCTESEDRQFPKRRIKSSEIQHVISSSLDQIGRTLTEQLNAARELRDKSNKYEVPNSNQRIDEIFEEHQKQKEIYVNIKSEYEVQLQNKGNDANTTNSGDSPRTDDLKQR